VDTFLLVIVYLQLTVFVLDITNCMLNRSLWIR